MKVIPESDESVNPSYGKGNGFTALLATSLEKVTVASDTNDPGVQDDH
jgi:hypothetical protein